MEQLIAGAKFPAKCVKNEIHNLLTTLRLTQRTSSHTPQAQFHQTSLRSFQRLFEELTYIHELHEFDTVSYLRPFLEVIQSDAADGQLTAVALAAVDKFVSFGLIRPDSPRCTEAVNTLAWGVINCRFISTHIQTDEVVLLKMVELLIDCLRCPAGDYLGDPCVWHMVRKCFQISRQPRASHLLRSSAEGILQQMVLTIFGTQKERARRVRVTTTDAPAAVGGGSAGSRSPKASAKGVALGAALADAARPGEIQRAVQVYKPYGFKAMHFVLRFLSFLLAYGRTPQGGAERESKPRRTVRRQRSRSPSEDRSTTASGGSRDGSPAAEESPASLGLGLSDTSAVGQEDLCIGTHCLGLSLLNVALESGGDEIARSDELIGVIQDDICKSLLQNSRSDSLSELSLTLRAIFNLFLHFKRHLKVQLEIFFTSVHLKIAGNDAAAYEQRELALESLLEFCREPELMLELYENYDCDVRCTNLFETMVKFLVTHAFPADGVNGVRGGFNSLHRLALSGLLSILHSIALRCEGRHFRAEGAALAASEKPSAPASAAETELQRKKEQKRRLAIAAHTFNSEPSKSMGALQSLGLVTSPPTPESMAEFLRHTPGLDLRQVGEYLSKRKDFNGEVRKQFMELFPFTGLGLVEALRMLLGSFRLPGESQLIERLMESFAEAYFRRQPAVLEGAASEDPLKTVRWITRERACEEAADEAAGSPGSGGGGPEDAAGEAPQRIRMAASDTIFVLSYSIIMVNTDLHNPRVKKKMSVEEYMRNNRGIDNGRDLPEIFLRDIYEAIRDEEIRLHDDAPIEGGNETVVDDFFWEGVLKRSESIDEFSTTERLLSETPPGGTERDMLQVFMDCSPLPTLSLCYESIQDATVASQAMTGFEDLAKISAYFEQAETVNNLVRVMCQYFSRASSGGVLTVRSQIALRAALSCVAQHSALFKEAEWRTVLDVLLQLWALDLLPPHLTEFDDFTNTDGKPLESLCDLRPPFTPPAAGQQQDPQAPSWVGGLDGGGADDGSPGRMDSSDGFLESLARWFEDETRDSDEDPVQHPNAMGMGGAFGSNALGSFVPGGEDAADSDLAAAAALAGGEEALPVASSDPAAVYQQVKQYVERSGFVELFGHVGVTRLPADSLQVLAKALVQVSRPAKWSAAPAGASGASADSPGNAAAGARRSETPAAGWHDVADPVFGLELLTNMTCMPLGPGQSVSQIWPLVSTHFERLLQYVIAGGGGSERQFIERLIVNTLRLCIRLVGNAELVPTLLTLMQHLAKLPSGLFATYSERVACGLLVLVKETNLPHSGLCAIFALLKRISDCPGGAGACSAGLEVLNSWLTDDQELSRLLSLQQFPELLTTLKAFARQPTSAAATALGHLSSLVPQLARGARCLPQAHHDQWQSLWVPTLHALADIAKEGSQKSSAQAFMYLQRLLLERGTELSLPWEQLPYAAWKECLEQVLFPLLQAQPATETGAGSVGGGPSAEVAAARRASAAQLICRVVLTHLPDWLTSSPDSFPVLFLRLLHILVSEASAPGPSGEPLVESLKNLLLVISADPVFQELASPQHGETLLEAAWSVVAPSLPELRREVALILDPSAAEAMEAPQAAA